MAEETGEGAKAPKPRKMVNIYNKSRWGQAVTIHNGGKIQPGQSAKVPLELGKKLIESIPYIVRAERGDPMA